MPEDFKIASVKVLLGRTSAWQLASGSAVALPQSLCDLLPGRKHTRSATYLRDRLRVPHLGRLAVSTCCLDVTSLRGFLQA